jgi:hypothetical protein
MLAGSGAEIMDKNNDKQIGFEQIQKDITSANKKIEIFFIVFSSIIAGVVLMMIMVIIFFSLLKRNAKIVEKVELSTVEEQNNIPCIQRNMSFDNVELFI